ncbi:pentapeptide repeat-containing protein, partial [Streptomyces sp. NPDC001890]|uniref:pentapeptide repeat-containing protein n=1 Tax=Streptomyces sp. NPDC001890 TaxID=3364620 RepID=UPI003691AAF3
TSGAAALGILGDQPTKSCQACRVERSAGQALGLTAATLPGLAAVLALLFTWREVRVAEQGQLTSRFNDAITNLGSQSLDVRFGGIYALERIMQDSPRDQPRIISVLSAYIRSHAPVPADGFAKEPKDLAVTLKRRPSTDVAAVMNVLAHRPPGHDGGAQLDWNRTDLRGLTLFAWDIKDIAEIPKGGELPSTRSSFSYAVMEGADLRHAVLAGVDLRNAFASEANMSGATFLRASLTHSQLYGADLTGAALVETDLTGADLSSANLHETELGRRPDAPVGTESSNLTNAVLWDADLTGASLHGTNLTGAILVDANLKGASLPRAKLHGAKLSAADKSLQFKITSGLVTDSANLANADLSGADLTDADLRGVNLTGANLTNADLRGARLTGAKLTRAKTHGTRGLPPSTSPG